MLIYYAQSFTARELFSDLQIRSIRILPLTSSSCLKESLLIHHIQIKMSSCSICMCVISVSVCLYMGAFK